VARLAERVVDIEASADGGVVKAVELRGAVPPVIVRNL
jgi:hypothetical protein